MKKLLKHAFSAGIQTSRPTKTVTDANGNTITLVALPVLPASPFRTTDSRSGIEFSYDAGQLIERHASRKRKLPLDVDHHTEQGFGDTKARGWIHELTTDDREPGMGLEPGFLHAWTELNPLGNQELSDQLYGFTSGVATGVWVDESHVMFTGIKSLALTNNPANEMPMAFTAEESDEDEAEEQGQSVQAAYTEHQSDATDDDPMLKELLELLKLGSDADKTAAFARIQQLLAAEATTTEVQSNFTAAQTETASFRSQVETLTTQLTAATEQLTTTTTALNAANEKLAAIEAEAFEAKVTAAVDAAVQARKITPAQKEQMTLLARANLEAFTQAMSAAPEILTPGKATGPAADAVTTSLSAEDLAKAKAAGISPETYAEAQRKAREQLGL